MESQRCKVTFQSHPARKYKKWNLHPYLTDSCSRGVRLCHLGGAPHEYEGCIQCLELKRGDLGGKMGEQCSSFSLTFVHAVCIA